MIEINLIPDVKLELIRARRLRAIVISVAVIVSIVAGSIVALLASYVFGVQTIMRTTTEGIIKEQMTELQSQKDLPKLLTIQNQLEDLESAHGKKTMSSRVFDLMSVTLPTGVNEVALTKLSIDVTEKRMEIEGEAINGFESLEVFKKTLAVTKLAYIDEEGKSQSVTIVSDIQEGDRGYGERADGTRVLRFSLSFTYDETIFMPSIKNASFVGPVKQNATDSKQGVPQGLFTNPSKSEEEG